MHQVIDLGALADPCRHKGAAIDRRTGADLTVITNLDVAQLRHLDVLAVLKTIAEAIGAQHGVGMNDDAITENRAFI